MRDKVELVYVDAARRRLHQAASPPRASATCSTRARHRGRDRLHRRRGRRRRADRSVVHDERERALRPAGHRPDQHGRRVRRAVGPGRRAQLRRRSTSTRCWPTAYDNVFAIGDATNLPTSKAGSVAHFQAECSSRTSSTHRRAADDPCRTSTGTPTASSSPGYGKALLIDFNYDDRAAARALPAPRRRPVHACSRRRATNHWGKLGFRWVYWNVLLPGRPLPVSAQMSMAGKHLETPDRRPTMPVTEIDGRQVHVDDEGFMTEYDEWTDDLGRDTRRTDRHHPDRRPLGRRSASCDRTSAAAGRPPPPARDQASAASRSSSCSPCSPRSRPRRWPTSPGSPSRTAASDAREDDHDHHRPPPAPRPDSSPTSTTTRPTARSAIICSKGNLDMAYPGLILANAALGEGVETHHLLHLLGPGHDHHVADERPAVQPGRQRRDAPARSATSGLPQALAPLPGMTGDGDQDAEEADRRPRRPRGARVPRPDRRRGRPPVGLPDVGRHERSSSEADLRDDVEGIISASDFIEMSAGAQLIFI